MTAAMTTKMVAQIATSEVWHLGCSRAAPVPAFVEQSAAVKQTISKIALKRVHEHRSDEVSRCCTRGSQCWLPAGGRQTTFCGERHQHQGYKDRHQALARRALFQTIDPTE